MDLHYSDATDQIAALATGEVSSLELLDAAMAREESSREALNCVIRRDPEGARAKARAADAARAAGSPLGRLGGLPMTLKDSFDLDGMPAHCGAPELADRTGACTDAVVVGHARREGAIFWGKTNLPYMAGDGQSYNAVYGVTNNPWDVTRTPAGSSGGAAAALAAGITALEIGSDIGLSLRHPAHACGVYSLKPTWEALSQIGHVPPEPGALRITDLNVVGPMARSARDLRLLFEVMGGPPAPAAAGRGLKGARLALWLDEPELPVSAAVQAPIQALAAAMAAEGATVDPAARPAIDFGGLLDSYLTLLLAVTGSGLPPHLIALSEQAKAALGGAKVSGLDLFTMMGFGPKLITSHAEWLAAHEVRCRAQKAVAEFFGDWDAILMPIGATPAIKHDHREPAPIRTIDVDGREVPYFIFLGFACLATALKLPAVSIPAGLSPEGLPVGLQIIGPAGSEHRLLDLAEDVAARIGGFRRPPGY